MDCGMINGYRTANKRHLASAPTIPHMLTVYLAR